MLHRIFNTERAVVYLNIYQLHVNLRIFMGVRAQKDRQTNEIHKHFPTMSESVFKKKSITMFYTRALEL